MENDDFGAIYIGDSVKELTKIMKEMNKNISRIAEELAIINERSYANED